MSEARETIILAWLNGDLSVLHSFFFFGMRSSWLVGTDGKSINAHGMHPALWPSSFQTPSSLSSHPPLACGVAGEVGSNHKGLEQKYASQNQASLEALPFSVSSTAKPSKMTKKWAQVRPSGASLLCVPAIDRCSTARTELPQLLASRRPVSQ